MLDWSSLTFPATGVLAGWWRQLAPLQPQALWVGQLFWHRVETLVEALVSQPLDRLGALVLSDLALHSDSLDIAFLRRFRERLQFPEAMLQHTLRTLRARDLVEPQRIALTDRGRQALAHGAVQRAAWQRRTLTFIEQWDQAGQRFAPPHFLALDVPHAETWSGAPAWDDRWMRDGLELPEEEKRACGFPMDVQSLGGSATGDAPEWQRVTVVRPERLGAVLALCGEGPGCRLAAFAARDAGLNLSRPMFQTPATILANLPALAPAPTDDDVRQAWLAWCRGHGITSGLIEIPVCSVQGMALNVAAPLLLVHALRGKRCGLEGQEWLLVGSGPLRRAVQVFVTCSA